MSAKAFKNSYKRVKRTTSSLYKQGIITREDLERLREMSKATREDCLMAIETIKALYRMKGLNPPTFI